MPGLEQVPRKGGVDKVDSWSKVPPSGMEPLNLEDGVSLGPGRFMCLYSTSPSHRPNIPNTGGARTLKNCVQILLNLSLKLKN